MTEDFEKKIKNLQYKGTPIFGRDSNPQNTSEFIALSGTVVLWLILFLFFIFAKPFAKKQEFKPVQIVLSSTPVAKTEKKETAAASSAASAPKAASSESSVKKQETVKQVKENPAPAKPAPKQAETPKKAAQSPSTPAPKPQEKIAMKHEEPFVPAAIDMSDENNFFADTKKESSSVWNDNLFNNEDDTPTEINNHKVELKTTFKDAASENVKKDNAGVTSQTEGEQEGSEEASDETKGLLDGIRKVKYLGNAGKGHSSELTASVSGKDGKLEMTNGSLRALIKPDEPHIDLSEDAASKIDTTINVSIIIEVQPSGNVTSVEFNPTSIVPPLVQQEIRDQIMRNWLFEKENFSSIGKFQYTIKKI